MKSKTSISFLGGPMDPSPLPPPSVTLEGSCFALPGGEECRKGPLGTA